MESCTFRRRRCLGSFAKRQITISDLIVKAYQLDLKAKYIGFYEFLTPIIVLRDLDLIKTVIMKNVNQFSDHRPLVNRKVDPMLGGMPFMLNGDQWKDHRNMLSPTFTSSKIKTIFKLMSECVSRFAEHL
ncbi:cytochrome P450 9e2-like [Frieseomelitta varia]|uniref:cytochrome P450 9e2-like n=1 Tax=Frieseomelitta varia TaxID=561572 RepID=UPI001CB6A1F1|nr:cytochrome P450 9e2-like [Frieseomelitta varia]